jgi:hypothetical protein
MLDPLRCAGEEARLRDLMSPEEYVTRIALHAAHVTATARHPRR